MTTAELIEAVRALVIRWRAIDGYVCENISIDRYGDRRYWNAHVWFRRCERPVDGSDVVAVIGDSPEDALRKLESGLTVRKGNPIRRRDVMPDEIDEDPEDDDRAALESASSVECSSTSHERSHSDESEA